MKKIVYFFLLIFLTTFSYYNFDLIQKLFYPLEYKETILKYSKQNKVDPSMVVAVIYEESHFNSEAVSKAGAIGLMQLMPKTAEWISKTLKEKTPDQSNLTDPVQNIRYGSWYLSFLKKRYGRNDLALAAYNGGFQNVDKWLSQSFAKGGSINDIEITFGETREFVKRVQSTRKIYQRLYTEELK